MATNNNPNYNKLKYDTPEKYKNTCKNGSAIIISSGSSTGDILKYKDKIRTKFNVVICVNYSFRDFDDIIDYHLVVEKTTPHNAVNINIELDKKEYRKDVPRIVNWKGIQYYNHKYNIHKTTRSNFNLKPNIREYKYAGSEGLLSWRKNSRNMSPGTVTLSAMHFAGILGVDEIYLIGAEFCFKDQFDHYYKDIFYRNKKITDAIPLHNRLHIVEVEHKGKKYKTTDFFRDSAAAVNEVIPTIFKDIKVYDFSNGLITEATPLDVDKFFEGK